MENLATWLVNLLLVYAGLGVVFAFPFVLRGVGRVDPAAWDATWSSRLLLLPGAAAFWPFLALRWLLGVGPPEEDNPHRRAARETGG